MTSILTNAAATAALQTLREINSGMSRVQGQVSSGLRVQTASDNAAYWSIATTMRSDNMAISAVSDALGLGAATVDVAYTGIDNVIDVLDEIKSKLVAAREPGVDKGKIQKELAELKQQATSITSSANFNGVNWLGTDVAQNLLNVSTFKAQVVSSFNRSSQGAVSVGTIDIDLATVSMLNSGGGGALQRDIRSMGTIGGFRGAQFTTSTHQGHQDQPFTGARTFSGTDFINFDLTVDASNYSSGDTYTVVIDKALIDAALGTTTGTIGNSEDMRAVLDRYFIDNGIPATGFSYIGTGPGDGRYEIGSLETSGYPGSSIYITNVSSSFGGSAMGLESNQHNIDHDNMYPSWTFSFDTAFTVQNLSTFSFDVRMGTGPSSVVTVDRATVDAALGTTDGVISSATDLATVLTLAGQGAGMAAIASGNNIELTADHTMYPDAGTKAPQMALANVRDNIGWVLDFDLADVDITQPGITIDHYIDGIEEMLTKATTAAAKLGSMQMRIDQQSEFVSRLTSVIERGVGHLVDADMNEASTRLKALQTQQQLGIQSLSIANNRSDAVLQLFAR